MGVCVGRWGKGLISGLSFLVGITVESEVAVELLETSLIHGYLWWPFRVDSAEPPSTGLAIPPGEGSDEAL